MRLDTRLDSAIFQLTPTRTRFDLVINGHGKAEKIASGLLNPFLAHLKTARDQIEKGGYSITLKPDPENDAEWFTKGTLQRFVRFVSTPEVLERVTTIESEILQIEGAIAVQGNDKLGLITVDEQNKKPTEHNDGIKTASNTDEKSIILYMPESPAEPAVSNKTTTWEGNSKTELLQVLETRKNVLQKEQAMAFARAVAAGYDVNDMSQLIAFAECFGASRMRKACVQFMDLWKRKHETGQWIEVEPQQAILSRPELPPFCVSGVACAGDLKHNTESVSAPVDEQKVDPLSQSLPGGLYGYSQGQNHQHTYPPWMMHPPSGHSFYQHYPMQMMPFYQNYPGTGPYFHPAYSPVDDTRVHDSEQNGRRRHSTDSREITDPDTRSKDDTDQSASENGREESHGRESWKWNGHSAKKKLGVVAIHNVHNASNGLDSLGCGSHSTSEAESEENAMDSSSKLMGKRVGNPSHSSSKKQNLDVDYSDMNGKHQRTNGLDGDSSDWQAFQNFLLRAEEKMRDNRSEADPVAALERDPKSILDRRTVVGFDSVGGSGSRIRQISSSYDSQTSGNRYTSTENGLKEIEGVGGLYRSITRDDVIIYSREKHSTGKNNLDLAAERECNHAYSGKSSHIVADDAVMLPVVSGLLDHIESRSRIAIDIVSENSSVPQKKNESFARAKNRNMYEPDIQSILPERRQENGFVGYDPARDYERMIQMNHRKKEVPNCHDATAKAKGNRRAEKDKKVKSSPNALDKKDSVFRRLSTSKSNPPAVARLSDKQANKSDIQRVKKKMEEEKMRRLEALKLERQKRIAARSTASSGTYSAPPSKQTISRTAPKISPSAYKSSKFSDSEPNSSSPLKIFPIRFLSSVPTDPTRTIGASRLNGSSNRSGQSISVTADSGKGKNGTEKEGPSSVRSRKLLNIEGTKNDRSSACRSGSLDHGLRRIMPEKSQMKKISATTQLDGGKPATSPEMNSRSENLFIRKHNRPSAKDVALKGLEDKTSLASRRKKIYRVEDAATRIAGSGNNAISKKSIKT